MRLAIAAALLSAHSASAACSAAYGDCFNSTCCLNGNFGCMRSTVHRGFAQCRPMPATGCMEEDNWECPGWEHCSDHHGDCTVTKCCKDAGYGCFRRPHQNYAQCRVCKRKAGASRLFFA